jgi:hypothetical protein
MDLDLTAFITMDRNSMRNSPLVHLLFSSGIPAYGYEFRHHSLTDRELMRKDVLAQPGAVAFETPSVTMVEIEMENTIYLITQAGHFAHPGILRRSLVKQNAQRNIEVSGFTVGSPETMSTWMAQFQQQDGQIRAAEV